jgi:hypothetical protein
MSQFNRTRNMINLTLISERLSAGLVFEQVQSFLVLMIFITSCYVKFEPAPTDLFLVLGLIVSIGGGLRLPITIMPLILILLIYNIAGLISYSLIPADQLNANAYLIGLAGTSVSAVFLAFSRRAWINAVAPKVIMVVGTFILLPSNHLRGRILFSALVGLGLLGVAIVILLLVPATLEVYLDGFTLVKPYDAGETGRFGNQLKAIPMLQTLLLGFDPYQFEVIFGLAPHNTFINSFAAAGWLGGVSYITLVVSNFIAGIKTMLARTPYQPSAIVVVSCLLPMILRGIQIDTEHWRRLYWMTGIAWGLFAASFVYLRKPASAVAIADGWNIGKPAVAV